MPTHTENKLIETKDIEIQVGSKMTGTVCV
jgi:hypothetical protein